MQADSNPRLNLPSEISFNQGESNTIDFIQYISNFSYDLDLSWEGNENVQIEKNGWDVTFSSYNVSWMGSEDILFVLSGEFGESESTITVNSVDPSSVLIDNQGDILVYYSHYLASLVIINKSNYQFNVVEVFDTQGRMITNRTISIGTGVNSLYINELPKGIYIVRLKGEKTLSKKIGI